MTTEETLEEALEEWGYEFTGVADDVSDYGLSLLGAPENQVPYELLDWAMATMRGVSRLLRAASDELFPLDDDLKESIAKMFEPSNKPTPVKVDENGDGHG